MSAVDSISSAHNDDPFVTIAIPTFNRASLLKDCVAAALAQTYNRFEVLVSDNASTDGTQGILSEFSDQRLRVLRQKTNIGLIPNWNACLDNARGDYIVLVSDDDRVSPWLLERCMDLVRRQPQVPIVVTLSDLHAASYGKVRPARASKAFTTGVWDGTDILMEFLTDRITVTVCGVMLRTDLLRMRGGFPLDYPHTADLAAWAPLLFLGNAGFVNEACATFCYHDKSETARLGVERLLRDGRRTAELIARMADAHVDEPSKRGMIKVRARGCFARRGLTVLSDYRNSGGDTQRIVNFLWRFRNDLSGVSLKDLLRFAAIVLCPQAITDWLRRLRPGAPAERA